MPATALPSRRPDTAIVLAGGFGTRLRGVVAGTPKVLAPVAGKPFLFYVLANLARQGIRKVILSTGYLAGQIRAAVGDGSAWGLAVTCIAETTPLGTGGALRLASRGLARPFYALNGDTLLLADLKRLWKHHLACRALATLALLHETGASARGNVTLSESGMITGFVEKPGHEISARETLVSGGLYLLEPAALAAIPPGASASIERDVFPALAAQGVLAGLVQEAYFADIGTPDSLQAFERDVITGRVPL